MNKTLYTIAAAAVATTPQPEGLDGVPLPPLLPLLWYFIHCCRLPYVSPPDLGGRPFASILPGGDVSQLLAKAQPKVGKRPFVSKIQ